MIWGNCGHLGLPLLTAALGPQAALPTVAVITFDILLPASLTLALLEGQRSGEANRLAALQRTTGGAAAADLHQSGCDQRDSDSRRFSRHLRAL